MLKDWWVRLDNLQCFLQLRRRGNSHEQRCRIGQTGENLMRRQGVLKWMYVRCCNGNDLLGVIHKGMHEYLASEEGLSGGARLGSQELFYVCLSVSPLCGFYFSHHCNLFQYISLYLSIYFLLARGPGKISWKITILFGLIAYISGGFGSLVIWLLVNTPIFNISRN